VKPPVHVPTLFGHWLVLGDRLECRLPRRTVTVRAPRKLLQEIARLCDGSRTWTEVLETLHGTWSADTVGAFLLRLAGEGVLVESGELWAHWSDIAQIPQATRVAASEEEIARLALVARERLLPGQGRWHDTVRAGTNPLAQLLCERESTRTFDDRPLTAETLYSALWAAHGVTRPAAEPSVGWHRTVGSGGNMHSARWFVAVLRSLPAADQTAAPTAPGIYEARFHTDGGVTLEHLAAHAERAWHCLRDPRVLRYASALLLPVFDVSVPARKYGNRATLFAMLEAGQCLQNAQLMALSLDAACMLRGDTVASHVLELLALDKAGGHHWLSLPAMVLGAAPTPHQKQQQTSEHALTFTPNIKASDADFSFAFAAAPVGRGDAGILTGSGRSCDPFAAADIAEAEALERLGWATLRASQEAMWSELQSRVDPRELVAYSARQYRSAAFPFRPFAKDERYLWTPATDCDTDATVWMLAECVHALHALPAQFQATAYTNTSTSGVAAGVDLDEALQRATLELCERDAFCRAWLSGGAPAAIDAASLPSALSSRLNALRAQGLETTLLDLSTPWCVVIAAFGQHAGMPFTAITSAAGFDLERVTAKTISEMEGRFAFVQHFPAKRADGDDMEIIESYYRNPRTFRRSDFFRVAQRQIPFEHAGRNAARHWSEMRARMRSDGFKLLCSDITPANARIDQGRRELWVARAFVPGLIPIWFRQGLQPQGMRRFAEAAGVEGGRPAGHFLHPFT
jgi:thiazole/oxazole-forming peptide maturase SagD family component